MTRLDRRALFASGAAAALLSATGVSLAAAPRRGGRLRLAVARDGALESVARAARFDTLTEIAPDGLLRGELAAGWQGSADARIWRFDLRAGVRFHDGAALTAGDVVASLGTHDGLDRAELRDLWATGPLSLRLALSRANPDLPYLLADPALVIARGGQMSEPRIGTGAYRAARWQPGRDFLGELVADHYRSGEAGWLDSIEVIVIPDAGVRAEALRDGFVDVAALPAPAGLRGRGEFRYHPSADNMALAVADGVGMPRVIGDRGALDDGRIAERWWMV
jgi:peptide/nickel transport system substrate-binding protein